MYESLTSLNKSTFGFSVNSEPHGSAVVSGRLLKSATDLAFSIAFDKAAARGK